MEKKELIITKDMTIGEIIMLKPSAISVLMSIGLSCIGCPASQMETVEQAAAVHGIPTDILLERLNA